MNVVVIAPHPDDEILGCGGTLLKHKQNGDSIHIVYVTEMQEKQGFQKKKIEQRLIEIRDIKKQLNASIFFLNYPTASLSDSDVVTMVPKLSKIFSECAPEVVYLPHYYDAHSDHGVAFKAAFSCTKTFRYPSVKCILTYETISETDFSPTYSSHVFIPNYFVDVSEFLFEKLELMKIYESELGEHPFPRSIENIKALATLRGAAAGVASAEAFYLLKSIQ